MRQETLRASLSAHEQELSVAVLCDVPVLITSERKDERSACARSLHSRSLRGSGPFVEFDCGAQSTPVAPGVFVAGTGRLDGSAIQRGFDEAGGGTLFLDRIEMMGSTLRQQLFLLLEEGALQRRVETPTGMRRVRMIAGASHTLLSAVGTGCFDESLFYRLNVIHLDFTSHQYVTGEPMWQ
jgi:DNA-binding NtrC family response regulator